MHRVFADGPITVLTLTLMFCFVCYTTSGVFEEFFKEFATLAIALHGVCKAWVERTPLDDVSRYDELVFRYMEGRMIKDVRFQGAP